MESLGVDYIDKSEVLTPADEEYHLDKRKYLVPAWPAPGSEFCNRGVATPADATLPMELGSDGVFVGTGIFKSENPEKYAKAIVEATAFSRLWTDRESFKRSWNCDERN